MINSKLKDACAVILKDMLAQCNEGEQTMFKRMYAHNNLDMPIDEAVDHMLNGRTDDTVTDLLWRVNNAMNQCERTIAKKAEA